MNSVKVYQTFLHLGLSEQEADEVVKALAERNSDNATKTDINDLELRLVREMKHQTSVYIGGLAALGIAFKIAEILIQKFL